MTQVCMVATKPYSLTILNIGNAIHMIKIHIMLRPLHLTVMCSKLVRVSGNYLHIY